MFLPLIYPYDCTIQKLKYHVRGAPVEFVPFHNKLPRACFARIAKREHCTRVKTIYFANIVTTCLIVDFFFLLQVHDSVIY